MSEVKRPLWTCIVEVHGDKINKNKTTKKKKKRRIQSKRQKIFKSCDNYVLIFDL